MLARIISKVLMIFKNSNEILIVLDPHLSLLPGTFSAFPSFRRVGRVAKMGLAVVEEAMPNR